MSNIKFSLGTYNKRFNCHGPDKNQKCPPKNELPKNSILMPHYGNISTKTRHAASIRIQSSGGGRMRLGGIKGGGIPSSTPFIPGYTTYDWTKHEAGDPAPRQRRWKGVASDDTGLRLFACEQGVPAGVSDLFDKSLYISTDYGITWTDVWQPQSATPPAIGPPYDNSMDWISVCSDSTGENLGAITYDGSGAYSDDYGATWNYFVDLSGPTSVWGPRETSWNTIVSSSDGGVKYACSAKGPLKKWTSGTNWDMILGLTTSPTNPYPAGIIWTERLAGDPVPPERRWKGIASDTTGDKLFACTQGDVAGANHGLYVSDNSGSTWKDTWIVGALTSGLFVSDMNWISACSSSDGENLGALTFDSSGAFSINRGDNWTYFTDLSSASPYGVTDNSYNTITSSEEGLVKYVCSANGAVKISADSGATWAMCAGVTESYPSLWMERLVGSPPPPERRWKGIASNGDGTKLIACEQGSLGAVTDLCCNSLYVSGDSGVTWTNVWNPQTTSPGATPPPYDSSMNWTSVCSDSTGSNLSAVSYDGSGAFSADSGSNWTLFNTTVGSPVYTLPDTSYNTIVSHKTGGATGTKYVCSLNGPIKRYTATVPTWTMCPGVTTAFPVADVCLNITQEWFTTVYSGSSFSYIRAKGIGWVGDHLLVGIHALNGAMTGAVYNSVEANFGTVASGCEVGFLSKTDVLTGIDVNDSIWTTKWPATLFPAVEGGNTSQGLVSTRALVVDTSEKVYVAGFVGNCGGQDGGYIRDPTTQTDGSNNNFWKDGRQSNGPIAGTGPNAPLGVGLSNAFVSKYDADGTRIWSRGIQTTSNVINVSLTTDSNNNVIAPVHSVGLLAKNGVGTDLGTSGWLSGGATYGGLGSGSMVNITSTELPAGVNGYQGENGFVVKFDEDGVPLYYTMIWSDGSGGTGGTGLVLPTSDNGTQLNAVTTDSNNDVYIGGKTKAALYGDPSSNPFPVFTQATPFIKKLSDTLTFALDSAGNSWDRYIIPATFTLSNNGSTTNSVVTDSLDNIYAVGHIKEGGTNKVSAFLAKYSSSGVSDTTFAVLGGGGSSNDLSGVKIYQNTLDAAKSLNFQSCYIDNNDRLFVVGTYGGSGASGMEWDISNCTAGPFPGTTDVSNGSIGTTPAFGDNDIVLYVFNATTALVEDSHLLKITNDNDGAQGYYSITGDTSNNIYICGGADATTGVQTPYTWKAKYSAGEGTSRVGAKWAGMCCDNTGAKFAAVIEGTGGEIYTSTDSGDTLVLPSTGGSGSGTGWRAIACSDDFVKQYAATGSGATPGNLFVSVDSGDTWTQLSTGAGFPPVDQQWSAITMDSDGSVIAAVIGGDEGDESSTGTIWLSVDYGATWTEQIPPPVTMPGTKNWQAITSNADGSKLAACVGDGSQEPPGSVVGNIWTYDSAGGVPAEWTGICCNTDGARMAVCNTTHIYISSDSGATLEQKQIATAPAEWSAIACSDDFIFQVAAEGYGTSTGRVWLSIDGGENWTQNAGAPAAQWKSVTINNDGTMIAAVVGGNTTNTTTAGSIWISEDSGVTWSEQTPIPGTKSWQSITSNTDGTMLAAAVGDGKQSPTGTIVGNIWTSVGGAPPEWDGNVL